MTTQCIGITFPMRFQWGINEKQLLKNIHEQIQQHWPSQNNLLINTTWFGPQFNNNSEYRRFVELCSLDKFDNLFLLSSVDPICLTAEQIQQCQIISGAKHLYLLGNFENQYQFNFISTLLPIYFNSYSVEQLLPTDFEYIFLSYNRKPHEHRVDLVNLIENGNLISKGLVTLGNRYTLNEQPTIGNWGMSLDLGIPHDIHSLGNLDLWRKHFLNVVSETIFYPWDPLFITEKTFKPIIGLRPFVINGQSKIYNWLRKQGFKTFNNYWPHIDLENATDVTTGQCIIDLLTWLQDQDINQMYQHMLLDLKYNRQRFFEFAQEQKYKIDNLFE